MQTEVLNRANYWNRVIQLKRLMPDRTQKIDGCFMVDPASEDFNQKITK